MASPSKYKGVKIVTKNSWIYHGPIDLEISTKVEYPLHVFIFSARNI